MNCLGAEVVISHFPLGHENPFIIAQQPEKCVQNRVINNPNQTVVSLNEINTRMQELMGFCLNRSIKSIEK